MSDANPERALPPARSEATDVRFVSMLGLLMLIGGGLLATLLFAWLVFPDEVRDHRFTQPFPEYPAPALQIDPPRDMAAFRAAQMRQLNGAGWVDRAAGTVHIPIDQAMRAVAAEGIQGWPFAPPKDGERR